jgi:hypothetical protein
LLVLSYQPSVLRYPVRYAKTEALMVEVPIFDRRYQTSQCFRLSSQKYWSSKGWKARGVSGHNIKNLWSVLLLPSGSFGSFHLLCLTRQKGLQWVVRRKGRRARLSVGSMRSEAAGVVAWFHQSSFRSQQVENSPSHETRSNRSFVCMKRMRFYGQYWE